MATTYTLISSNVLTGSAASVTFSSIPSTYTDLLVRLSVRSDSTSDDAILTQINGSTSGIYSQTYIAGDSSTAYSGRTTNDTTFRYAIMPTAKAGYTSNTFAISELYIPSYTASQNKAMSFVNASESNTTGAYLTENEAFAYLFRSTSAITSIGFTTAGAKNFVSGSSFYLYGINNS